METAEILALFDREQRADITYLGTTREVQPHAVRIVRPKPGKSFVLYSDLNEHNADSVIDEQIAYFTSKDLPFEWKVFGHDKPADLTERLVARGLVADAPEAIMLLDLERAPAELLGPVPALVRRLEDPAELEDVVVVLESVWGGDFGWVHQRLGAEMAVPDTISVYVVSVAGHPASVAWVYFPAGHFATFWAGSTVESLRGRGLYTALLAARVQEALARGKRYAILDAGPMSKPIVARYGFRELTTATACDWPEAASG